MLAKVVACVAVWWGAVGGFVTPSGSPKHPPLELPPFLDPETCPPSFQGSNPVILVSMDGFRAEYLTRGLTPTLVELGKGGVMTPYMKPSFPTKTFPNHYTIATGLYPSAHGIVANHMYDPVFKARFSVGRPESLRQRWWGGEPIWKTVENQGKRSATFFWPGSEVEGLQPTHWFTYNKSLPFSHRVDQVLSWMDLPPEQRPDFVTLYMHDPDTAGHKFGPHSPEVEEALIHVDSMIRRLVDGLASRQVLSCVNLVLLADHGMSEGGQDKVLRLDKYAANFTERTKDFWDGTFARFSPADGKIESKLSLMRDLSCKAKELRVYDKTLLPIRWHMGGQRRVEQVVVDTDAGFSVAGDAAFKADLGDHGYDNFFPYMNAMFMAHGPAFRRGVEVESFQNIEVYNLLCHLVGVTPAPNNGTWGALHHMLKKPPRLPLSPPLRSLPAPATLFDKTPRTVAMTGCEGDKLMDQSLLAALAEAEKDAGAVVTTHVPWGPPGVGRKGATSLLLHPTHVTLFSHEVKLPLWTSFSVESVEGGARRGAWRSDTRLPWAVTPTCRSYDSVRAYNVTQQPLYPPGFYTCRECGDNSAMPFLMSNGVPMTGQLAGRWGELLAFVRRWQWQFGPVNVLTGPVFDYDHDSVADDLGKISGGGLVVPTHMFLVVTRCLTWVEALNSCPPHHLDVLAFVYPQYLPVTNCLDPARFAQEFSAKVSDVELITGLRLFPLAPPDTQVKLRTRIHSNIWGYESWWNRLRSSGPGQIGFR